MTPIPYRSPRGRSPGSPCLDRIEAPGGSFHLYSVFREVQCGTPGVGRLPRTGDWAVEGSEKPLGQARAQPHQVGVLSHQSWDGGAFKACPHPCQGHKAARAEGLAGSEAPKQTRSCLVLSLLLSSVSPGASPPQKCAGLLLARETGGPCKRGPGTQPTSWAILACRLWCAMRWARCLKLLSHSLQLKGRSPVWTRWWSSR